MHYEEANLNIPIKHVSNSAAILDLRECDFNMVRLGISLYGPYPSSEVSRDIKLKTALELKAIVSNIKTIEKETSVSYSGTYTAHYLLVMQIVSLEHKKILKHL